SSLIELLGPARQPNEPLEQKHKDLARSVQVTYEKAFLALLQALHKMHPCDHLALSGGCAMNSVANGKVYRRTPFKQMYLPAAAGDAGGAIGAAAYVQSQLDNSGGNGAQDRQSTDEFTSAIYDLRSRRGLTTAYLGPWATDEEFHALLDWKRKEL